MSMHAFHLKRVYDPSAAEDGQVVGQPEFAQLRRNKAQLCIPVESQLGQLPQQAVGLRSEVILDGESIQVFEIGRRALGEQQWATHSVRAKSGSDAIDDLLDAHRCDEACTLYRKELRESMDVGYSYAQRIPRGAMQCCAEGWSELLMVQVPFRTCSVTDRGWGPPRSPRFSLDYLVGLAWFRLGSYADARTCFEWVDRNSDWLEAAHDCWLLTKEFEEGLATEFPFVARCLETNDAEEGGRAFLEKRAPRWSGA